MFSDSRIPCSLLPLRRQLPKIGTPVELNDEMLFTQMPIEPPDVKASAYLQPVVIQRVELYVAVTELFTVAAGAVRVAPVATAKAAVAARSVLLFISAV